MKLVEIYELITQNTPAILIIVLVLMTIVQITPIKIDPWSKLLKFLGKAFNANISEQVGRSSGEGPRLCKSCPRAALWREASPRRV